MVPVWLPKGFEFLSGLPERQRRKRQIVTLQAWIDDSGTKGTGKLLILGGLMAPADVLADIADEWDRELPARIPLPISYFKADEARKLSGEFQHWRTEARDEKVRRMASVVDRDDVAMLFCAVDLGAHRTLEEHVGEPATDAKHHPYNNPYLLTTFSIVMAVAQEMHRRKSHERAEVIFDEHVVFKEKVRLFYDLLLKNAPASMREWLPVEPMFRDDKAFVLLQAADLLASSARMVVEKTPGWTHIEWKRLRVSPFCKTWAAEELSELSRAPLARKLGLPESALNFTVVRPDDERA